MRKTKTNCANVIFRLRHYSLFWGITGISLLGAANASAENVSEQSSEKVSSVLQSVQSKLRIRGQVYEKLANPMPMVGVNITVKGKPVGVTTDMDGIFDIEVDKGDVLVFSFIGFKTAEYRVERREANLVISLEEDVNTLNEVVVTGISEERKLNSISAISQVKIEANVVNKPITSLSQALQGGITGISVSQGSGLPGGDAATIKIRGISTIGNSDPLVLVAGSEHHRECDCTERCCSRGCLRFTCSQWCDCRKNQTRGCGESNRELQRIRRCAEGYLYA